MLLPPPAQVVQWLWQVIGEFSHDERKLFLKFFTGSDRAPIGGLGNLRCIIQRDGPDSNKLPTSHTVGAALSSCWPEGCSGVPTVLPSTACVPVHRPCLPPCSQCFNTLLLPSYRSNEKLADRLKLAILNSEGFGE